MSRVIDIKPKSGLIIDSKPTASGFIDTKPTMKDISGEAEIYYVDGTIEKGEGIGLLLALTYNEDSAFTVVRP